MRRVLHRTAGVLRRQQTRQALLSGARPTMRQQLDEMEEALLGAAAALERQRERQRETREEKKSTSEMKKEERTRLQPAGRSNSSSRRRLGI